MDVSKCGTKENPLAFRDEDIWEVMALEIKQGSRFVVNHETGRTLDDDLVLKYGNKNYNGKRSNRRKCRKHRQNYLEDKQRERFRVEVAGFMADRMPGTYYDRNRGRLLAHKSAKRDDPAWREADLAEKKKYRQENLQSIRKKGQEYSKTDAYKLSQKRGQERYRIMRRFIREKLCDGCLFQLHTLLAPLFEKSDEKKDTNGRESS